MQATGQTAISGIMGQIINWLEARRTFSLVAVLLLSQILVHLPYVTLPPTGRHVWRQTQTLSVARNFYEEGGSIFQPRVDSRGNLTGIAGMEFPVVNYIIAQGYAVFGFSHTLSRVVMLLLSFTGIVGCFQFVRYLMGSKVMGFVAAVFLIFSPLFLYYSITALPDVPALCLLFVSLACWQIGKTVNRGRYAVWALVFLAISALIKITGIIVVLWYLFDIVKSPQSRSTRLRMVLASGAACGIVASWYVYARYLNITYGNEDFVLGAVLPYGTAIILPRLQDVFVKWMPGFVVNRAETVLLVVGAFSLLRIRVASAVEFLVLSTVPLLAFMSSMLPMFEHHEYYLTTTLVPLVVLGTMGVRFALEWSSRSRALQAMVAVLLLAVPVAGCANALPRFHWSPINADLLGIEAHLDKVIPDRAELVIAAEDQSPSIDLYFMHRKGWSTTADVSTDKFENMLERGARYLISDSRTLEGRPEISRYLQKQSTFGKFNIYRLHQLGTAADSSVLSTRLSVAGNSL